jgi:hypothetical protein
LPLQRVQHRIAWRSASRAATSNFNFSSTPLSALQAAFALTYAAPWHQ